MGIIELLLASLLFGLSGVFNRMISTSAGAFTAMLARTLIPLILFYLTSRINKNKFQIKNKKDLSLFIFRGVIVVLDVIAFFLAVTKLELGITLLIFYVTFLIVNFSIGKIIFKEKTTVLNIMAAIIAIIGLVISYLNIGKSLDLFAVICAATSGLCYGLNTTTSKLLSKDHSVTSINLITYLFASMFAVPVWLIALASNLELLHLPLSTDSILGMILIGTSTFLTFFLVITGFKKTEVNKASLIMLSEIIFTFIFGYIFYSESPTLNTILGGILIIISLGLPYLKFKA